MMLALDSRSRSDRSESSGPSLFCSRLSTCATDSTRVPGAAVRGATVERTAELAAPAGSGLTRTLEAGRMSSVNKERINKRLMSTMIKVTGILSDQTD